MTYLTKSTFLRDYWTKSDGVFAEMQIIILYNPKAYSGLFTISKVIDAESPIIIFGGQSVL